MSQRRSQTAYFPRVLLRIALLSGGVLCAAGQRTMQTSSLTTRGAVNNLPPVDLLSAEPAIPAGRSQVDTARSPSPIRHGRRRLGALGRRVYRRSPAVRAALEEIAGVRLIGASAETAIGRLRDYQPRVFPLAEVLRVVDAIEAAGVPCWLAGGWGVDALAGAQTRVHGDLDLVLDDFEGEIDAVSRVLEGLGYEPRPPHETGVWLGPQAADFEAFGHRIEVLPVNWTVLASAVTLAAPTSDPGALRSAFRTACLSEGKLGSRTVRCLSIAAQALFHTGYLGRKTDKRDLAFLAARGQISARSDAALVRTALLIPSFDLDAGTGELWNQLNPGSTLPPHITLLYPFLPLSAITPESRSRLAALFASEPAFDYRFTRVGWFERRVTYLEPAPKDRFTTLVSRLSQEFDVLPYGGAFQEVVPHLTMAENLPAHRLKNAAVRAARHLPQHCHAVEAWLLAESGAEGWQIAGRFPLGAGGLAAQCGQSDAIRARMTSLG